MTGIYIGLALIALLSIVLLIITIRLIIRSRKEKRIREGHRQMLLQIIDSGGENVTDNNGNTPLILAVRYGFLDVFEKLLNKDANIDASDNNGNTAAHFAAALNNIPALKLLRKRGANLNTQSQSGITPIMVAIKARTYDTIDFFLNSEVNLKIQNTEGYNAITYAQNEWETVNKKLTKSKGAKKQAEILKKMQEIS